ncbi:AsnC family transcriptional regulator [Bradyrhizobium japonicum]|jgi:DNA-binding Lrp family transcriptional regulator|uniref:AsnC family transcriptional regulator n=1 Tax=Bradyrhizobium TaxID=374 RepID=UPI0032E37F20
MADRQDRRSERRSDTSPPAFDLADRKILSALQADGRLTVSELGAKAGLSQSACWRRG